MACRRPLPTQAPDAAPIGAATVRERQPRASRIKFRFYHKQRGFVAEYGRPSCVGCGRCIGACPVNIDVVQVIDRLRRVQDVASR